MNYEYKVGNVYPTSCGVDAKIITTDGFGKQMVMIQWLDEHGHECIVRSTHLDKGEVYNPYAKSVYGVGYLGVGEYAASVSGKHTLEYSIWKGVFQRCYEEKLLVTNPTYVGCSVHVDWRCFQNFAEWINKQIGWGNKGWHLDKDLLSKGNKIYGPDTCIMLPEKLNQIITNRVRFRGDYPIGVYKEKSRNQFSSQYVDIDGKKKFKRFWTIDEAFNYYKTNKERVIRLVAETYKNQIDPRAYDALMSWEISVYD